jgi:hypothetical protein
LVAGYDINAFVQTASPKVLLADCTAVGVMVRTTTAPQAVDGESWAETGRVSFKINPGAPAPDRRTITLMASARSMSVPNTPREYIV